VYGILDRLEDADWITGSWEEPSVDGRPRRRLYQLTPTGHAEAENILAAHRPRARNVAGTGPARRPAALGGIRRPHAPHLGGA
jgi:PadR family transcriptional regulator PadR